MGVTVFPAPAAAAGFDLTKLALRHTVTSSSSITIPVGTTWVYAVLIGGGGGGSNGTVAPTAGGGGAFAAAPAAAAGWSF